MAQVSSPSPARGLLSPAVPLLMLAFSAAALLVAALSGCSVPARSRQELVIASFSAEPVAARPALHLRFDRPLVKQAEVGCALHSPPLSRAGALVFLVGRRSDGSRNQNGCRCSVRC